MQLFVEITVELSYMISHFYNVLHNSLNIGKGNYGIIRHSLHHLLANTLHLTPIHNKVHSELNATLFDNPDKILSYFAGRMLSNFVALRQFFSIFFKLCRIKVPWLSVMRKTSLDTFSVISDTLFVYI